MPTTMENDFPVESPPYVISLPEIFITAHPSHSRGGFGVCTADDAVAAE